MALVLVHLMAESPLALQWKRHSTSLMPRTKHSYAGGMYGFKDIRCYAHFSREECTKHHLLHLLLHPLPSVGLLFFRWNIAVISDVKTTTVPLYVVYHSDLYGHDFTA